MARRSDVTTTLPKSYRETFQPDHRLAAGLRRVEGTVQQEREERSQSLRGLERRLGSGPGTSSGRRFGPRRRRFEASARLE